MRPVPAQGSANAKRSCRSTESPRTPRYGWLCAKRDLLPSRGVAAPVRVAQPKSRSACWRRLRDVSRVRPVAAPLFGQVARKIKCQIQFSRFAPCFEIALKLAILYRYKTAPSPTASARRLTDTVGARWPTRAGMAGAEQWREYKGEIRLGCFAPYIEMELNFGDCVL